MRTLLLDNYDSFTFNLFQLLARVNGEAPHVVRNDQVGWEELAALDFDNIVLSPGPGRPDVPGDFGVCREALLNATIPVLGVCLGHQGLGVLAGAQVVPAPEVMHGRTSRIRHDGRGLFSGLPQDFAAVRYHSLTVAPPLPSELVLTAWTPDGVVMGLQHRERPLFGVQFHPESIGTEHGAQLLLNFRRLTEERARSGRPRGTAIPRELSVVPAGRAAKREGRFAVRSRELSTELDAEQVFTQHYASTPDAFWLDSSRSGTDASRFSFMGDANGPLGMRAPTLDVVRRVLEERRTPRADLPFDFQGGFVGYVGYEAKAEQGHLTRHVSALPHVHFVFVDRLIAFDHQTGRTYLVCVCAEGEEAEAEQWLDETAKRLSSLTPSPRAARASLGRTPHLRLARDRETYLRDIAAAQRAIRAGETYEVCLTNQLHVDVALEPLDFYRTLRSLNPAPFSAFLRAGNATVACSSPERFLRVGTDGWVESKPIKGTRPRGRTEAEDAALRDQLRSSEKERSENLMIVDLLRNDLGQVCEVGSVHVPKLMDVETYATVHQLVSTVRGKLRDGLDALDALRHAFPGGSMTGAPKRRTMELLDGLESEARGIYSGALGYLACNGAADFNIVIRTAVITPGHVSVGVGGAVVALSDAEAEFEETLLKGRAVLGALTDYLGVKLVVDEGSSLHDAAV